MTAQAVAFAYQAGQRARLVVDGRLNTLSVDPGVIPATATSVVTDQLEYGRGGRGTTVPLAYWLGKSAFLALSSRALSTVEMEAMTAALIDPRRLYGIGSGNLVTDSNRSPVGLPIVETATAGVAKTTTVTTAAYDPNGDALTVTDAAVVSGAGTVTLPSPTQVRYTGNSGVTQELVVDMGIRDAGLKSTRQRLYSILTG